jgi:biotin transport system substrate-specific component
VDLAYLLVGIVGVPVFADASGGVHVVFGATGGYIVGFIPAAYLIGLAAKHGADRTPWRAVPLFAAGQAVIFAVGVPWLAVVAHLDAQQALAAGFYPFILGGIVKAVVAAGVLGGAWALIHRR